MGAAESKDVKALPPARESLATAELDLLEAFASAFTGTRQHFELLCLLAEQKRAENLLGRSSQARASESKRGEETSDGDLASLEKAIASYIKLNDPEKTSDTVRRYLFRKALQAYDPFRSATHPSEGKQGESKTAGSASVSAWEDMRSTEEGKEILKILTDEFRPPTYHSQPASASVADSSVPEPAGGEAWKAPLLSAEDLKDFSLNLKAVETSERIGEEIRKGFADAKHRDGMPNFMHAFNQGTYTHEDEQVVSAAGTSDQAAYHYLTNCSGLPDVDGVEGMVKRLLSSSWVGKRTSQHALAMSYFKHLPLASLRSLKGFFSSWDSEVEMLWLQEVIARLAPPAHVDMSINLEALTQYCDQVWAVLDSTSLAARTANNMRTLIAFQRVKLAYNEAGQTWLSKSCQDALLAFFRIPMRGFKWELTDAKGFFGQISADMWLRNAAYAHGLTEQSCLALPDVSVQEMERVVGDALTAILGADNKAKPGSNLSPWSKYCSDTYLKAVQAVGRVTAGDDPLVWEKTLAEFGYRFDVSSLEKLRALVELRFSDANRDYFAATEDASIAFVAKGVPSVQVKLYELNTNSYYIDKLEEIPSDLALDGLLPFEAIPFDFQATAKAAGGVWSPFKRQIVSVALPPLVGSDVTPRRGVFIVEVTGGGTSVRAVIRKGSLRFVERTTIGGHVLTVLDECNRPLPPTRVSVQFAGRRYAPSPANAGKPNETDILIPFAASQTTAPLVLTLEGEEQQEGGIDNAWSFSTLIPSWTCKHEWYTLEAAMHVERESLIKDNYGAQLLVRPKLLLHGELPAPLGALVDVSLDLSSTDAEGNTSSRVFRPMAISSESETALSFAVPQGLRSLGSTMSASVEIIATGSRSQLSVSQQLALNGIESTNDTRDFFLRKDATHGFVLYVFGKTGEPVGGTNVRVTLAHSQLTSSYTELVTASPLGAIRLGPLDGYSSVSVYDNSSGSSASFDLPQDTATFPTAIHTTTAGDGGAFDAAANPSSTKRRAVQAVLPFRPTLKPGDNNPVRYKLSSRDLSVVEVRTFPGAHQDTATRPIVDVLASASSRAAHASFDAGSGFILLHDLPAGQYQVTLKRPYPGCTSPPPTITIRVLQAEGATVVNGYVASGNLLLEARNITPTGQGAATIPECPVQIASINVESHTGSEPQVAIRVSGGRGGPGPAASKDVRVHVFATFFVSPWDAGAAFARLSLPSPSYKTCAPPLTRYLGSRTLSEEIKYVLDRQAALASDAPPLPGNLLPRPSLLLNPWSLGTADTEVQEAKGGTEFSRHRDAAYHRGGGGGAVVATRQVQATQHNQYMCMDFLSRPSVTLANLRPDAAGVVHIPLSQLATAGYDRTADWDLTLTVVAVDAWSTAATTAPIPLPKASEATRGAPFRDLTRSGSFLPLDTHVVHSSKSSVLAPAGDSLVINSAGTFVKVEPYGSLDKVFSFFAAHSDSSSSLTTDWGWLLQWPTLSENEKRTRYSKYACHEVHVWLYFKDQPFFDTVVRPFLLCKRAKTFVDHWVLGEDVSAYAAPYAFCRLNAFERALLAARTPSAAVAASIASDLKDAVENDPTSFSDMDAIFKAALASDGLSATAAPVPVPYAPPPPPPAAAPAMLYGGGARGPSGGYGGLPMPSAPVAMSLMSRNAGPSAQAFSARLSAPASRERGSEMKSKRRAVQKEVEEEADCSYACEDAPCAEMACDEVDICDDMPYESMRRSDEADLSAREVARQTATYRPLDKTEEFAEANYYKIRAEEDNAAMIPTNEFWRDFATYCARVHGLQEGFESSRDPLAAAIAHNPFVSASFGVIALNTKGSNASFNEMLLALAVLGLPFECATDAPVCKPAVASLDGGARIRYTSTGTPLVVFHQDLSPVPAVSSTTVLCGQNYFDPSDRYFTEKGIQRERYLPVCTTTAAGQAAMELLVGKVYGCMVVITNVSPEHQQLECLLQIPQGAMPASNGFFSRTQLVDLAPFATRRLEYLFYFPRTGDFGHYPVHVGSGGELLAHANVIFTKVTRRPTVHRDTTSWQYLSVHASTAELLTYLQQGNLEAVDLSRILWRCKEEGIYRQLIALFRSRGHFYEPLWAYGFLYGDARAVKEYLNRPSVTSTLLNSRLLGENSVGFTSPLVSIAGEEGVGPDTASIADTHPVLRQYSNYSYEHLEYSPLVNARAHVLGKKRTLLNKAVERQYRRLLVTLCIKPRFAIAPADLLAVVYHLLLQDRVNEALEVFSMVPPPEDSTVNTVNTTARSSSNWLTIQYDYMAAYLDFFRVRASSPLLATAASVSSSSAAPSPPPLPHTATAAAVPTGPYTFPVAATVAAAYKDYPIPKWAAKFKEVAQQIEEARRSEVIRTDATGTIGSHTSSFETETSKELSREAQQSKAVSREPSLELAVEGGEAIVTFSNLNSAVLRFYSMDVELLFSTSPFFSGKATGPGASASLGKFAFVRPNGVLPLALPAVPPGKVFEARFPLPEQFKDRDTMVEVITSQASIRRAVPYFANKLNVSVTESFGRLKVTAAGTGAPLPRTYVKVYTRTSEGDKGRFYKDGYTDLRGVFDYVSLSSATSGSINRFALLTVSDKHGSSITTAAPPGV